MLPIPPTGDIEYENQKKIAIFNLTEVNLYTTRVIIKRIMKKSTRHSSTGDLKRGILFIYNNTHE